MGVKIIGGNLTNGNVGVKVAGDVPVEIHGLNMDHIKTAYDISSGVPAAPVELQQLRQAIPAETPPEDLTDGVQAAAQAIQEGSDATAAVRESKLWRWISALGPDVAELVVKVGTKVIEAMGPK